jgi:hypothetical protein
MTSGCRTSARLKPFLWVSILVVLALHSTPAQGKLSSNPGEPEFPREVVLRPEVVPYELGSVNWNLGKTNKPFLKEPELSQQHVFRSALRFGKGTNNAFALIWDQPKRKLYLDLNRNLDLTDDSAGVFSSTNKGFRQFFTDVALPLTAAPGRSPAMVDLWLSADADGRWLQAHLTSRSLWQARVALGGEEWQVAAVDNLFGSEGPAAAEFLLLRPWAVRTNRVYLHSPAYGIVPFPNQLFWLGRAFHLDRRIETGGEYPVCKLEFTPQQPPLTELKLSGEFLCYAVLRATNGYTVVLHGPAGTVKVPQGVYSVGTAWLKQGAAEAFRGGYPPRVVKATMATNLSLGGPLTNWLTAERYGRKLVMSCEVKGAGGESYRLAQEDRGKPPQFTVYHGGKKVLSDKFQYG